MDRLAVVTPIIHLNGDRRETFLEQLKVAYHAVSEAIHALEQCSGNQRNFYPEPGRFERYEQQHRERQMHLQAVRASLEAEAIQIHKETP